MPGPVNTFYAKSLYYFGIGELSVELRHFHSFIAVAEELSFTKAAKRLRIAQPPVTRHIRDLETELGVQLFQRNSNRVFLTDAGRSFLNEIRVALQHVSQAVEAARQVENGSAGTVRLGIGRAWETLSAGSSTNISGWLPRWKSMSGT